MKKILFALLLMTWPGMAVAEDPLCPDVASEKANGPSSVAGVQADIERLNLCVERAKLLKQLDDIAVERDTMLKKITDPALAISSGMTGIGTGLGAVPAMPGSALPPLPTDITGLQQGGAKGGTHVTGPGGAPLGNAPGAATSPVIRTPEWKVRKIWGQGDMMRAQLSDGGNALLNVLKGDTLPDGKIVAGVSIKGVAVSQNGKTIDLPWDDAAPAETMTSNNLGLNAAPTTAQ